MAETLGSLCDKLTIVKLKQYHTDDAGKLKSLSEQEEQLKDELNCFISDAVRGRIPPARLTFNAHKVYTEQENETREITGTLGQVFGELAKINCELWHEQEKVYDFESVAPEDRIKVVKRLAVLNLERTQCIDVINSTLKDMVGGRRAT
jgi:hypothetical protein